MTIQWKRVMVGPVRLAELADQPGTCAACRRPFDQHDPGQLASCSAVYEETVPDGLPLPDGCTRHHFPPEKCGEACAWNRALDDAARALGGP